MNKKLLILICPLTAIYIFTGLVTAVAQSSVINTIAGVQGVSGFNGDGAATGATLNFPQGICTDVSGNLYIADRQNNRVRKVTASGDITTVAGNGSYGYSGDSGPATDAALAFPNAVCFDAAGNMYIADANNNVVRKVDVAGNIFTIAGNGTMGYNGDGIAATEATLSTPFGIAADTAGNVYIADFGNSRIRKVNGAGIISTVAGDSVSGYSGDGGMATNAELYYPGGVAWAPSGDLYIADFNNSRIRKVTTSGIISTIAGNGIKGYSGDGGAATAAQIYYPVALALDNAGNLYVADDGNGYVRKINREGTISLVAGNGTYDYTGDGGPATNASFRIPEGVAVDGAGNVYITDGQNFIIREITNPGALSVKNDVIKDGAIMISPNPSSTRIAIQLPPYQDCGTLSIYNMNGQLVKYCHTNGPLIEINIGELSDGVYFVYYTTQMMRCINTFTKVRY